MINGDKIGTPQSTAPTRELVMAQQSTYAPGATPSDAWTRHPHSPASPLIVLSRTEVLMYQDVIGPTLRNQQPSEVISEVRHETPVTTYTYSMTYGDFYECAPTVFELARRVDGNAADDAEVTITVSLDSKWVVRYLDVNVDYHSVL